MPILFDSEVNGKFAIQITKKRCTQDLVVLLGILEAQMHLFIRPIQQLDSELLGLLD